ncbi:MAG: hypothetical protein LBH61_06655, partial [Dysgonamonadaceae bacterium]|nr:hypothetical protein [Dysgonamonadaceae bacterium]
MSEGIGVDYTISSNVIVDNTYSGSGYIISIDSLFAGPSDALAFPVGTFDIKESISRIYVVVLHGGSSASAAEKIQVVEGTVTVAQSGDKYTVAIDATNINGSELEVSYTGSIEVAPATIYANEPLAVSTQNFEIEEIAFESNNVDVDRDSQVDLSLSTLTLTGAKTRIVIDEIVGLPYMIGAEPKRPEAGTYNLTEWTYEDSSFTPGEIYNGQLTGSYAWLLSNPETPSFSEMWYFTEAQMVVSETNGVYSIQIT